VSAAEAFHAHSDERVCILTADPAAPYERPALSKEYLRGETDDIDLHLPQWYDDRSIELIGDLRVDRIDVRARKVIARGNELAYRALVLACGAAPTEMPVPGADSALQLRSLSDAHGCTTPPRMPTPRSSSARASSAAKQRPRWCGRAWR
jgi:NAD(P)H-nitrite reductase large subunit